MIVKEDTTSSVKKQSEELTPSKMDFKCPLCLENLADDINFFPCKCSYQVCRFCWHRIRTNENGLCPQCRRAYTEDPANFKPLTPEELAKLKTEKKKKEMLKKKEVAESRKQLANIRVVQKNLVFVHGLPVGIDQQEEKYQKLLQIFKEFGTVVKSVVNNRTKYAGAQTPRASIYVTYQKISDALRAYKSLPSRIEEYEVKTSLGTTKYCSNFLKNVHCPKQDCMYLHDTAEEELCFTKEQIHAGEHLSFGNQLYDRMMSQNSKKSQSKDPIISEQQEEVLPKPSPVPVKESVNISPNTETSHSPRQNNTSPQQSRLQPLFNRDSQNQIQESEELQTPVGTRYVHKDGVGTIGNRDFHNQTLETEEVRTPFDVLRCSAMLCNRDSPNHAQEPNNRDLPLAAHLAMKAQAHAHAQMEAMRNLQMNGGTPTPKSLNEESTVNISHRTVNNSEIFTHQESQNTPKDMWSDHRNSTIRPPPNSVHNHQNTNFISNDYLLNGVDSAEQILSNLSVNHQENGTSHSEQPRSESLSDILGFDPVGVSLDGFQDIFRSQESIPTATVNAPHVQWQQRTPMTANLMAMKMLELQKRKNPPPGFTANNIQPNQPVATSSYDSRHNVLIDRMIPENVQNSMRNNMFVGRMSPKEIPNPTGNVLIGRMNPETVPNPIRNNVVIDRMFQETIPNTMRNSMMLARMNEENESSPYNAQRNNILINRMSPVNVPNTFSPVRANFQVPRYQQGGVSVNSNAVLNGYSTPPVRNFTPQPSPQQAQAMQELLARSLSSQQLQQSQNIPHTQFQRVDPNLSSRNNVVIDRAYQESFSNAMRSAVMLARMKEENESNSYSPQTSMWNVNQSQQWMPAENSFQAQGMQDFRPASPLLNVRRIQPQLRPIQQVPARFNNPSPFSDNPQFIYPSAQHNQQQQQQQIPKESVHGFP